MEERPINSQLNSILSAEEKRNPLGFSIFSSARNDAKFLMGKLSHRFFSSNVFTLRLADFRHSLVIASRFIRRYPIDRDFDFKRTLYIDILRWQVVLHYLSPRRKKNLQLEIFNLIDSFWPWCEYCKTYGLLCTDCPFFQAIKIKGRISVPERYFCGCHSHFRPLEIPRKVNNEEKLKSLTNENLSQMYRSLKRDVLSYIRVLCEKFRKEDKRDETKK